MSEELAYLRNKLIDAGQNDADVDPQLSPLGSKLNTNLAVGSSQTSTIKLQTAQSRAVLGIFARVLTDDPKLTDEDIDAIEEDLRALYERIDSADLPKVLNGWMLGFIDTFHMAAIRVRIQGPRVALRESIVLAAEASSPPTIIRQEVYDSLSDEQSSVLVEFRTYMSKRVAQMRAWGITFQNVDRGVRLLEMGWKAWNGFNGDGPPLLLSAPTILPEAIPQSPADDATT